MENGDLVIKYKIELSIDNKLDKQIEKCLKTLGYKWRGSGISISDNIRDISFSKE
ncbi:hypothetical protein LCGC14_0546700 [marine sediment metagenome]|uniref:Uncharacterized protein n=1 Tax=marine sediment metagenome TaxID=412755 RepID=A0A0F9L0M4_9ZZZZ